jgi:diguanylate cyclase (GGDEF)-like protein
MNKPLQRPADSPPRPAPRGRGEFLPGIVAHKALEITSRLQTSLDPTRLIELFSREVGTLIEHQGIRYRNEALDLEIRRGRQARHSCTCRLNIGDEPLGKLTVWRNSKFTETETGILEQLLCSLLYPLRNALLYQDAVQLAQRDPLTGAYNRAALDEMLRQELSHAHRHASCCALLMLDIDHFKAVNDSYGHVIGDCALKAVANMARGCKRDGDLLFRYGGEEFVILVRDTACDGAALLAERIRRHIEAHPCQCPEGEFAMTVSIGISVLRDNDTPATLFARADQALYRAKRNGRNQVCIAHTPAPLQ